MILKWNKQINSEAIGQLISKCLFGIFNSPKKWTKKIPLYYYGTSSRIVFDCFLGELKTPKRYFEINWQSNNQAIYLIHRYYTNNNWTVRISKGFTFCLVHARLAFEIFWKCFFFCNLNVKCSNLLLVYDYGMIINFIYLYFLGKSLKKHDINSNTERQFNKFSLVQLPTLQPEPTLSTTIINGIVSWRGGGGGGRGSWMRVTGW